MPNIIIIVTTNDNCHAQNFKHINGVIFQFEVVQFDTSSRHFNYRY